MRKVTISIKITVILCVCQSLYAFHCHSNGVDRRQNSPTCNCLPKRSALSLVRTDVNYGRNNVLWYHDFSLLRSENSFYHIKLKNYNNNKNGLSTRLLLTLCEKSSKDNEDDSFSDKLGMEEAFKQLDSLRSLDDENECKPNLNPSKMSSLKSIQLAESSKDLILESKPPSIEREIETYKDMIHEAEKNEKAEIYNEMIVDLGSKILIPTNSTYADVILELGGTPKANSSIQATIIAKPTTTLYEQSITKDGKSYGSDQMLNEAVDEAMKEVTLKNPHISSSNLLSDPELMKEIEAIFNEGNEKLIQSLNDIRKEQEAIAKEAAKNKAQKNLDDMISDSKRLENAGKSMNMMLEKVHRETKNVEIAMSELEYANEQLNDSFLYKLKKGGITKQASLIGLIMFSFRSLFDTINAISNNDEAYLLNGLIQGVIAVVCAAIFFLIK